jgi:DNA-binding response OmpR family regulator
MKIIIIEDDPDIVSMITLTLKIRWSESEIISSGLGAEGVRMVKINDPDLILLDLGLPDIDGLDVLRKIRAFSGAPVLILTVRNDDSDIVAGLELGADDYMTKPYNQIILISRVNALIRRHQFPNGHIAITYKHLKLLQDLSKVFINDKQVHLTRTEGLILLHLMQKAESIVTIAYLAHAIWGVDDMGVRETIRVYVHRLRDKIETDPQNPQLIHTEAGVGYILKMSSN